MLTTRTNLYIFSGITCLASITLFLLFRPKLAPVFANYSTQDSVLSRQISDLKAWGKFESYTSDILNRTDGNRLKATELLLADWLAKYPDSSAIIIDIGSGLGYSDPCIAGITVFELTRNALIKRKARKIVATDIPSEYIRWIKNPERLALTATPIPLSYHLQIPYVLKQYPCDGLVCIRSANSIDIVMNGDETIDHFSSVINTCRNQEVLYMFNRHILHKAKSDSTFSFIGIIDPAAFDHRTRPWRESNYKPYYHLFN